MWLKRELQWILNELKKTKYTHIILDVVFSDGTSLEIVPMITRLYPDVKIMIYSMQPVEIYADVFKQYDIQYYLTKASNEETTVGMLTSF